MMSAKVRMYVSICTWVLQFGDRSETNEGQTDENPANKPDPSRRQ
jgi:hypothetical protein